MDDGNDNRSGNDGRVVSRSVVTYEKCEMHGGRRIYGSVVLKMCHYNT